MLTCSLSSFSRHYHLFSRSHASYFRVPFLIFVPSQLSESLEQADQKCFSSTVVKLTKSLVADSIKSTMSLSQLGLVSYKVLLNSIFD